jgi:hypothetical protein
VLGQWTWDQAYLGIGKVNETIAATDRDIYTIFLFANNTLIFPKGSAIPHIRYLLSQEYANERLVIFVGSSPIMELFLTTAGKVYGLRRILAKYSFVPTLEAALAKIEADKRSRIQVHESER